MPMPHTNLEKESLNDPNQVFSLPPMRSGQETLTPEQKRVQMQQLAMKLQSLRDPKVRTLFLNSNDPSKDNTLMHHARKVVGYYTDPKRVLPLQISIDSIDSIGANVSTPSSHNHQHQHQHRKRGLGQLVLSGPEFCHSLLSTVILPHYSQTNGVTSNHIDGLIDMSLLTIQSLGRLSSNSNPRSRTNNNGHDRDQKVLKRAGGTMSLGDLAEELLRLIINTPLPDVHVNGNTEQASGPLRRNKLTHLYNNTLNTWSAIAASESDPMVAKNAALRGEKLLLDLAMSQKNKAGPGQEQDSNTNNGKQQRSTLLEWIQPDIVSFNTIINAWSKSGRYEHVRGHKRDVTTVTAAERAQAILTLLQDLHDESQDFESVDDVLLPNRMSYEAVIQAWSRAMDREAPTRAMTVLEDMLERYHSFYAQNDRPNTESGASPPFPSHRTFSSALTTWARSSHVDAIEKTEEILDHMKKLGNKGFEHAKPDTFAYNALLYAYANRISSMIEKRDRNGKQHHKANMLQEAYSLCSRMDEIIQEMIDVNLNNGESITSEETHPNFITYKTTLFPLIDIGKDMMGLRRNQTVPFSIDECASRADSHLRKLERFMQQHSDSRRSSKILTIKPFKDLMTLYAAAGKQEKAKDIFDLLAKRDKSGGFSQIQVNRDDYDEMFDLLLQSGDKRRPCPKFLNDIDSFFTDSSSDHRIQLSRRMLNGLIESHSKLARNHIRHAKRADQIMTDALQSYNESLRAIITASQDGQRKRVDILRPNTFTLHNVLSGYVNACSSGKLSREERIRAIQRSEEVLAMMEEMHVKRTGSDDDPQVSNYFAKVSPNVKTYNMLLNAYTSRARYEVRKEDVEGILEKAELLLERMDTLFSTGQNILVKPDNYTYSSILNILAQSKSHDVKERAMLILNKTIASGALDNDVTVFNTALKVITNTKNASSQAVDMLEKLEDGSFSTGSTIIKPDKYTYSTVMAALANDGTVNAAKKVEDLYQRMVNRFESEISQNKRAAKNVQPDIYCYNSIIFAWANVGTIESCQRAEDHLDRLLLDDSSIGPDSSSFSSLIKGCSQRTDPAAAADCERILSKKEEYQRDNRSITVNLADYYQTINRYHNDKDPEGCLRILESLLRQLEVMGNRTTSNPDQLIIVYNAVMNCYYKTPGKDAAPNIQHVFEMLDADERVKPDHFTFFLLMNSHALSRSPDSFKTANNVLERIIKGHEQKNGDSIDPSIEFFDLLFKACDLSPASEDTGTNESPVTIAFERFSQIQSSNDPNLKSTNQTYSHLLAICKNHIQDETKRGELAKRLFHKCCDDGQLTDLSLSLCKDSMSDSQFEKILLDLGMGKSVSTTADFPKEYSFNVARKKHFRNHKGQRG